MGESGAPHSEEAQAKYQSVVQSARDAMTTVIVPNLCENGCGKPTWNGKPNEFCSNACRLEKQAEMAAKSGANCDGPGCFKPNWDGKKDPELGVGFCSLDCFEDYFIM